MPIKRPKILPSLRVPRRKHPQRSTGSAPGTIVVDPDALPPAIRGIGFDQEAMDEKTLDREELTEFVERWPVAWIDVDGLGDAELITRIGEMFDLHPLALEDVAHLHERAKVEVYENYLFIVGRMVHQRELHVHIEQFSLFIGDGWMISFQEHGGDCLEPVRDRIRQGRGRIRQRGADYLAYAFLDAVTDAYFPILDVFNESLEELEDRIIEGRDEAVLEVLHETKRALVPVRRAVLPLRDVVKFLEIDGLDTISADTRVYLRDVDDHLAVILDELDNLRELGASLMDVHYNVLSHKMNEVMKVLTMVATIFIPLSFVVGLYGMNFDTQSPHNMPELHWRYGYVFVWAVILTMVSSMLLFFRKRGWF